jgi:hypothetical protein
MHHRKELAANAQTPYVDAVTYWAVQGGSGWLNILRGQQEGGIQFPDQSIRDLKVLHAVLGNIIARAEGRPAQKIPGGASGSVAAHFPHTD